jgi:hypothetical protein
MACTETYWSTGWLKGESVVAANEGIISNSASSQPEDAFRTGLQRPGGRGEKAEADGTA